ncbi:MAG: peptidase M15, partial [Proteobacteria bacterium]
MKSPRSVRALERLGRVRLSESFFLREFLYSEISQIEGIPNIPDNPGIA